MNPVLHRNTKNTGTGASQVRAGVVTNGLEMLKRLQSSIPKIINSDATPQHLRQLWCDAPKTLDVLVKLSKNRLCCGAQYSAASFCLTQVTATFFQQIP
jgi:hypothetical protein